MQKDELSMVRKKGIAEPSGKRVTVLARGDAAVSFHIRNRNTNQGNKKERCVGTIDIHKFICFAVLMQTQVTKWTQSMYSNHDRSFMTPTSLLLSADVQFASRQPVTRYQAFSFLNIANTDCFCHFILRDCRLIRRAGLVFHIVIDTLSTLNVTCLCF